MAAVSMQPITRKDAEDLDVLLKGLGIPWSWILRRYGVQRARELTLLQAHDIWNLAGNGELEREFAENNTGEGMFAGYVSSLEKREAELMDLINGLNGKPQPTDQEHGWWMKELERVQGLLRQMKRPAGADHEKE